MFIFLYSSENMADKEHIQLIFLYLHLKKYLQAVLLSKFLYLVDRILLYYCARIRTCNFNLYQNQLTQEVQLSIISEKVIQSHKKDL